MTIEQSSPQIDPSQRLAEGQRMLKRTALAIAELLANQTYADLIAMLAHRPWLSSVLLLIGAVLGLMLGPKGRQMGDIGRSNRNPQ